MKFNPTTTEGAAITALFTRCKEWEDKAGEWPGADIVQELLVWFDQLGVNVDAGVEQLDGATGPPPRLEQAAKVYLSWDGTGWVVDAVNVDGAPLDAVHNHPVCQDGQPERAPEFDQADRTPLPTGREVGAALVEHGSVELDDLIVVDEDVTVIRHHRYGLTRVYRLPDSGRTLRVRIQRALNGRDDRVGHAVAEVLTDALTWTELVTAPPDWTHRTPSPASNLVDEFLVRDKLDPVARLLAERAATVLPPTHR